MDVLSDKSFLVTAQNGFLLAEEYYMEDYSYKIKIGMKLESVSFSETNNKIIERFKKEFPGKKLNQSLINFWNENGFKYSIE